MLYLILYAYLTCLSVQLYYMLVMQLKRARDTDQLTHPIVKIHAVVLIAVGIKLYITLNLVFGTLFFLDLPRELEFTKRCQRYLRGREQWPKWGWLLRYRIWLAESVCKHLLDPFDPRGKHC